MQLPSWNMAPKLTFRDMNRCIQSDNPARRGREGGSLMIFSVLLSSLLLIGYIWLLATLILHSIVILWTELKIYNKLPLFLSICDQQKGSMWSKVVLNLVEQTIIIVIADMISLLIYIFFGFGVATLNNINIHDHLHELCLYTAQQHDWYVYYRRNPCFSLH